MKQFHAFYKEGKFADAKRVAVKAGEIEPSNPAIQAAVHVAHVMQSCNTRATCCNGQECCTGEKCCKGCPDCCTDCCEQCQENAKAVKIKKAMTVQCPMCLPQGVTLGAPMHPPTTTPFRFNVAIPAPIAVQGTPIGVFRFVSGCDVCPVPPPPMPAHRVAAPLPPTMPITGVTAPPPQNTQYVIEARLMEKNADGSSGVKAAPTLAVVANQEAKFHCGGDSQLSFGVKVKPIHAGKVQVNVMLEESETHTSKQHGVMIVSDCCRIERSINLDKWVKFPLEPDVKVSDCDCWVEMRVREAPCVMPPPARITERPAVYGTRMAVPPVVGPATDFFVATPPPATPVYRPSQFAVPCNVIDTPVQTSALGCIRIVAADGKARLEIADDDTQITCEQLHIKSSDYGSVTIVAGKQVMMSNKDFRAAADRVTMSKKDCIVFEGHARVVYHKGKEHAEVQAEKIVLGLKDGSISVEMCTSIK